MVTINNQMAAYTGEDVAKAEHLLIASGSEDWYSGCGNQYVSSSENWELIYLKIQSYHSWASN